MSREPSTQTSGAGRPAVRIRRGGRPATPMRVYIWSRPAPPGGEPPRPPRDGPAPMVIELTAWARLLMITICTLIAVPLAGLIGFRQGFAEIVGVPDLQRELGASLSDGVRLILAAPLRIFDAGMNDTLSLMLAMLLVITGAGALALAVVGGRLREEPPADETSDEARIAPAPSIVAALGLVACAIVSVVQIAWVIARSRGVLGEFMPWTPLEFIPWQASVRITAGVDLVALAAAVVWLLVAVGLRWMLWLRSLTIVLASCAVAGLFAAASMSNSIASQIDQPRSLFRSGPADVDAAPELILGHTSTHLAVVSDGGELRLISPDVTIAVIGRRSIAEFITGPEKSAPDAIAPEHRP